MATDENAPLVELSEGPNEDELTTRYFGHVVVEVKRHTYKPSGVDLSDFAVILLMHDRQFADVPGVEMGKGYGLAITGERWAELATRIDDALLHAERQAKARDDNRRRQSRQETADQLAREEYERLRNALAVDAGKQQQP